MNKTVQILLLFALLPMIGIAREETLEERKQRIVRKYMRENLAITQSEIVVPSDLPEDERITDSEKFLDADVDLEKHDASSSPMMPPPRPRPVPRVDSNWLLDDTEEMADGSDPYGSSSIDSGEDLWSSWDTSSERRQTPTRQDRTYDPYATDSNGRMTDGRGQQGYSANQQQASGFGSGSVYSSRTDIFGQSRQTDRSANSSGYNLQGGTTRTYGSDPTEGMLSSPFPQMESSTSREEENSTPSGYQPYKSPYTQQREQRSQQWGTQVQQPKQEYKRTDSYEQFKERNNTWDPTQDDAYISEMMQKPKR